MDRLPVELLEHIFTLACIDGGMTGCALASVSHSVRHASDSIRYHSVSLRGAKQICAFLKLLDRVKAAESMERERKGPSGRKGQIELPEPFVQHLRPPTVLVRNLFLFDGPSTLWLKVPASWRVDSNPNVLSKFAYNVTRVYKRLRSDTSLEAGLDASVRGADAVKDLLFRLAPSLKHLCFAQDMSFMLFHILMFPALEELTYRLPMSPKVPASGGDHLYPRFLCTQFPMLERLHLIGQPMYRSPFRLDDTHRLPLSLQFVRLSNVWDPPELLAILASPEISLWTRRGVPDIHIARRPYVTIASIPPDTEQAKIPTPYWGPCNSDWDWDWLTPRIQSLEFSEWRKAASANKDISSQIFVVDDPDEYNVNWLYHQFFARMQGQEGCWEEGVALNVAGM
jgi:hypothetical protein